MATSNRFYLSTTDKKIGGVCGGIAEYFDLDPTFVRVAFVGLAFLGAWGIILYLVFWACAPKKP